MIGDSRRSSCARAAGVDGVEGGEKESADLDIVEGAIVEAAGQVVEYTALFVVQLVQDYVGFDLESASDKVFWRLDLI